MPPKRTPIEHLERVQGNKEPIGAQVLDQNDLPVNLTGVGVTINLVNTKTDAVFAAGAAVVVDGPAGRVGYNPVDADVGTIGQFGVYWLTNETPSRRFPYDGARQILNIRRAGASD